MREGGDRGLGAAEQSTVAQSSTSTSTSLSEPHPHKPLGDWHASPGKRTIRASALFCGQFSSFCFVFSRPMLWFAPSDAPKGCFVGVDAVSLVVVPQGRPEVRHRPKVPRRGVHCALCCNTP